MNKICRLNICTFRRQIIFIDRLFWSKKFQKVQLPFFGFFRNGMISRFSTTSTDFSTFQMLNIGLHNIGQGVFYGDYTKNSTELFAPQGSSFMSPTACFFYVAPQAPFLLCERNGGKNAVKGREFRISLPLTNPTL